MEEKYLNYVEQEEDTRVNYLYSTIYSPEKIKYVWKLQEEITQNCLDNEYNLTINLGMPGIGKSISTINICINSKYDTFYVSDDYNNVIEKYKYFKKKYPNKKILAIRSLNELINYFIGLNKEDSTYKKRWEKFRKEIKEVIDNSLGLNAIRDDNSLLKEEFKKFKKMYYSQFKIMEEMEFVLMTKDMFLNPMIYNFILEKDKSILIYDEKGLFDGESISFQTLPSKPYHFEKMYRKNLQDLEKKDIESFYFFSELDKLYKCINKFRKDLENFIEKHNPDEEIFFKYYNFQELVPINDWRLSEFAIQFNRDEYYENKFISIIEKRFLEPFIEIYLYNLIRYTSFNCKYGFELRNKDVSVCEKCERNTNCLIVNKSNNWINRVNLAIKKYSRFDNTFSHNEYSEDYFMKFYSPTKSYINRKFITFLEIFEEIFDIFYQDAKERKIALIKSDFNVIPHSQINLQAINQIKKYIISLIKSQKVIRYIDLKGVEQIKTIDYSYLEKINLLLNKHKVFILDADFNAKECKEVTENYLIKPYLMNYVDKKVYDYKNNFENYNYVNFKVENNNTIIFNEDNENRGYGMSSSIFNEDNINKIINYIIKPLQKKGIDVGLITHKDHINSFKHILPANRVFNFPAKGFNDLENCQVLIVLGSKDYGDAEYIENSYFKFEFFEKKDKYFEMLKEREFWKNYFRHNLKSNENNQAVQRNRGLKDLDFDKRKVVINFSYLSQNLNKLHRVINHNLNFENLGKTVCNVVDCRIKKNENEEIIEIDYEDSKYYKDMKKIINPILLRENPDLGIYFKESKVLEMFPDKKLKMKILSFLLEIERYLRKTKHLNKKRNENRE